jgi:hypothetical protein
MKGRVIIFLTAQISNASSCPTTNSLFFFLEKKEAKIQGCEKTAKNYSLRSSRTNSPARILICNCVPGSNNARLLSAAQKDAPLHNFFNAIFSRPDLAPIRE